MHDDFEQELMTDIAEADAVGDEEVAAELRLQLSSYRAAKNKALREDEALRESEAGQAGSDGGSTSS